MGGQIHYHIIKNNTEEKLLAGWQNPLPHRKNTTNLKVHFKKCEMEGSTKIQSQGSTKTTLIQIRTSQVVLNLLQIPALLILGINIFLKLMH